MWEFLAHAAAFAFGFLAVAGLACSVAALVWDN